MTEDEAHDALARLGDLTIKNKKLRIEVANRSRNEDDGGGSHGNNKAGAGGAGGGGIGESGDGGDEAASASGPDDDAN